MYELIGQGCVKLEVLNLVNVVFYKCCYYHSSVVVLNFINKLFTVVCRMGWGVGGVSHNFIINGTSEREEFMNSAL